jgi:hypothetical protein
VHLLLIEKLLTEYDPSELTSDEDLLSKINKESLKICKNSMIFAPDLEEI